MSISFSDNINDVIAGMQIHKQKPAELLRKEINIAITYLHTAVTDRTPVYTGTALRNWQWSAGTPASGELGDPGGPAPGATSSMALGTEPRRGIAQADADASLARLSLKNPFQTFWLSNNYGKIDELEYGMLPTAERSRSPAGMARISMKELEVIMKRR